MELKKIYPERVFYYFEQISKIPRESGNEKAISDYIVDFANKHKLFVYQDEAFNVLVRKEASKGYEAYNSIALQGHLDMVCEKNNEVDFDFKNEAIKLQVVDGFLTADGTTLGADNGIFVAMALAILESNEIKHPELEILLTSYEESGMIGAKKFDISKIKSKVLVNIDSEEYGSIYVSSAGSFITQSILEIELEETILKDNIYTIEVKGLQGGHSGIDISENRANANKVLAELISNISTMFDVNIINFNGGSKNNTIPREAIATLVVNEEYDKINHILQLFTDCLNYQYKESEKSILAVLQKVSYTNIKQLTNKSTKKVLEYIKNYPTGVIRKSKDMDNLIQTSLNLAIVKTSDNDMKVNSLIRGLKQKEQADILDYVTKYTERFGAKLTILEKYNPWEYKKDSEIREHFFNIFEKQNGFKPKIMAMHAGLECGIFAIKNPSLDIISIGPDIKNPHTPDEKMSIEAVANTWDYLLEALKEYKVK
ncbi:beta-Ala-His dipeptidase [Oceanivirga salmonicida]|uniref:beta-Ala-His dipeptidase n=1 Tax=Oceanivirga salmonicida TaxID=1769291 RepID=UPI00083653A0|nr:beta-Ala-His dipeptidase [Oceanivirga salmonicida]